MEGRARDGRSEAIVATPSPILMSHPAADLVWIDAEGSIEAGFETHAGYAAPTSVRMERIL